MHQIYCVVAGWLDFNSPNALPTADHLLIISTSTPSHRACVRRYKRQSQSELCQSKLDYSKMQTKFVLLFGLLALCCCSVSSSANNVAETVDACGDDIPKPTEIYVDGCDEYPCTVRNGTVVYFEMVFSPRKYHCLPLWVGLTINTFSLFSTWFGRADGLHESHVGSFGDPIHAIGRGQGCLWGIDWCQVSHCPGRVYSVWPRNDSKYSNPWRYGGHQIRPEGRHGQGGSLLQVQPNHHGMKSTAWQQLTVIERTWNITVTKAINMKSGSYQKLLCFVNSINGYIGHDSFGAGHQFL